VHEGWTRSLGLHAASLVIRVAAAAAIPMYFFVVLFMAITGASGITVGVDGLADIVGVATDR